MTPTLRASEPHRFALAPDLEISRVVTGLWQIADLERDGKLDAGQTAETMRPYVKAGFSTFDMADHYGSAEDIAGALRASLDPAATVQLLTKWVPKPGSYSREDVRAAVEISLGRLQSDAIDLLQFHAWRYSDPGWLDCLFWLQELKEEGLIRHLGVTNFDAPHARMALSSGVDLVSNQVCYSLIDQRPSGAMTELCAETGLHMLAFGTLAGGFLSDRWVGVADPTPQGLETWSQMKYYRFIEVAGGWDVFQTLLRAVREVADKHGVSVANVASRYVLDRPGVAAVIVGARLGVSENIEDSRHVFGFRLDHEDEHRLAGAAAALTPIPGDSGDEYRRPPFLTASGDLSDHFDTFPAPYETVEGPGARTRALSGTVWEDLAGFSRAVRQGHRILVSGTTATHGDRLIGGDDPAAQTHFIIDKIEGAIQSLGGSLEDVIRTRIYIDDEGDWEPVSRAHGLRFAHVRPTNTLVKAGLIGDGYLVEIEAEASLE